MNMEKISKLVSIKEASKLLGVTPLTLRNWDKAGKLKASRHPFNNYRVYKREDIEKLIDVASSNFSPTIAPKKKGLKKLQVKHIVQ
jgi:MerR family transcriptional regulator, copper efflux regulator